MTTIKQSVNTNADGSPTQVYVGGCYYHTMPEDELYERMVDDEWTYSDTFVGQLMCDTNVPTQWCVDVHDLTGTKAVEKLWSTTVYVVALRADHWK